MLKNKIKMFLVAMGLVCVIVTVSIFGGMGTKSKAYANSNFTYRTTTQQKSDLQDVKNVLKGLENSDVVVKPNSRGKILIYSSHSCEKNAGASVIQIHSNLAKKLRLKGFSVDNSTEKFAEEQGYNLSYSSSGRMLDKKDLSKYVLVLDIHTNSGVAPIVAKDKHGNEVAQIEMIQTKCNPNLQAESKISNAITREINKFGNISLGTNSFYFHGINYYNEAKSPNILLMEIGNNLNSKIETDRSCTYIASSIATALK